MRIIDQGVRFFHGTSFININSIINEGIKRVEGRWGEGELGAGFYTATTVRGAAAYLKDGGGVLEFESNEQMRGIDVMPPPKFDWTGCGRLKEITDICKMYDYVVSSADLPVSQFKFNYGSTSKLKPIAVHMLLDEDWERYTIKQYLDFM